MADIKKEFEKINPQKVPLESLDDQKESQEKKETLLIHEAGEENSLRQKIDAIDVDDSVKPQVSQTAQSIQGVASDEKIKKLLLVAEQKGVIYAVNVAKKMDDPYLLDMFHDALAAQGFYKKFKE